MSPPIGTDGERGWRFRLAGLAGRWHDAVVTERADE